MCRDFHHCYFYLLTNYPPNLCTYLPKVQRGFAVFLHAASDTEAHWCAVGELDGDISSISSLLQISQTRFESVKEIMGSAKSVKIESSL